MNNDIDFGLWEWEMIEHMGSETLDLLMASLKGGKDGPQR